MLHLRYFKGHKIYRENYNDNLSDKRSDIPISPWITLLFMVKKSAVEDKKNKIRNKWNQVKFYYSHPIVAP